VPFGHRVLELCRLSNPDATRPSKSFSDCGFLDRGVSATVRRGCADCQCVTDKNVLRVPILWRETFERRTASESFTYIRSSLRRQELEDWLKVNLSAFRIAAERAEHVQSSQRFLLGGLVTPSLKVC